MKSVKVSELKANLSKYLRMAGRGTRIVVKDRDEPVAEIGPPATAGTTWRERLAREGRLQLGTQQWEKLVVSRLDKPVDIQAALRAVREDPDEVPGR